MAQSAASTRASGHTHLLGIGQVLAKLQSEFPDLTPSKLRFLEEQGLVTPARSASGYRKFSAADVARITAVLAMQRDHYLPLKVIRTHLDAIDTGETPMLPVVAGAYLTGETRYHRDELVRAAGATQSLFDEAVAASVITPAEHYGEDERTILAALAALRSIGIEPRHLRGIRASAERDAALIARALAPSRRTDAAGQARAAEQSSEFAGHIEQVYASALRGAVRRATR